jgi:hypothetical protein
VDRTNPNPEHVADLTRLAELLRSERKLLLTRDEAAKALSMSVRSFRRHVQPHVKMIRRGNMFLVTTGEIENWVRRSTGR